MTKKEREDIARHVYVAEQGLQARRPSQTRAALEAIRKELRRG